MSTEDVVFKVVDTEGKLAWHGDDGSILPYIAGGNLEDTDTTSPAEGANDTVGDDTNLDTSTDTSAVDTAAAAADTGDTGTGEEEAIVEFGGEQFTASQLQEALKIQANQADFTTKNQEEAARLNTLASVIEEARQGLTNPNVSTPAAPQDTMSTFKSAEDFQEALLGDNPGEAIAQLANFIEETISSKTSETKAEAAFNTAYPDYLQVINSPEYKAFKAQSPLGAHLNDVNGFYEFKVSQMGNVVKDAETTSFKAGEQNALKHAAAKGNLRLLNSGGGVTQPAKVQITPDTAHGDVLNMATAALTASRSS